MDVGPDRDGHDDAGEVPPVPWPVVAAEIIETIDIDAPPERVWSVLTDFASYPDWNPFVRRISGDLVTGSRITVRLQPPGGRGMTFKPVIEEVTPGRSLRWLGRLGAPRIFDGEHSFTLEPRPGGGTHFVHAERFSGVLVAPLGRMLEATKLGFREFNEAIKQRAEAVPPAS